MKIAVYAICNGEKDFVGRFCGSAREADHIIIGNTGCTDRADEEAKMCGATVHDIYIRPWRFDLARNAVLALVPPDVDVCISLDIDEVLMPGWRQEIERVWVPGVTTNLWYKFDWGHGITFPYHKIHSRFGYHWHHPCHEDLRIDARIKEVRAETSMVLVKHLPDPEKSRGSYMELLEVAVAEDDRDPTHFFYYARELKFYRRYSEAIPALHKYLGMNGANNQNERCYAMRLLGECYAEIKDYVGAEMWLKKAADEASHTREPWCALAHLMHARERWSDCLMYALKALEIYHKLDVYTMDPKVWAGYPHDLAASAAWKLGNKAVALEQGELAAQKSPEDERMQANLKFYREAMGA